MWRKLSAHVQRLISLAQEEAKEHGDPKVYTEHLLLAIFTMDDSVGARVLAEMKVSRETLVAAMAEDEPRPLSDVPEGEIALSSKARNAIEFAHEEAEHLGHGHIGSEHVLLGLIREKDSLAGRLLSGQGVDLLKARELVISAQHSHS